MSSTNFLPSDEQRAATTSAESRFTVRAAAGSGKTSVLANRYVWFVREQGISPDRILTITFTNKSAEEMKSRIVNGLRDLGMLDAAQIAETGPIQTAHSFCQRLLKENAVWIGVDPEFELITDGRTAEIFDEALRRTLVYLPREDDLVASYISRHVGERAYRSLTGLETVIQRRVDKILDAVRTSSWTPETLEALYASPGALADAWLKVLTDDLPSEYRLWKSGESPAEVAARIRELMKQAGERRIPEWVRKASPAEVDGRYLEDAVALVRIAIETWRELDHIMDQRQQFDFARLERLAVDLVTTSPDARERLRGSYSVALVDEAQDLNPVQYQLLDGMGLEWEMLVGDPQQSIYRFRHADRELFMARSRDLPCLRLTKNHRSAPGILAFVDALFEKIWPDDYDPMRPSEPDEDLFGSVLPHDFTGVEFWPVEDDCERQIAFGVKEIVDSGTSARDIAVLVSNGKEAASYSTALTDAGVPNVIVGGRDAFYTRLEVRDIANFLEAVADPYNDLALLSFLRTPAVDLSLDAIVLLAQDKPIYPRLRTLQSPIAGDDEKVEEFLRWFEPITAYADRVPAWELIAEAFRASSWLASIAKRPNRDQELANMRKFLLVASGRLETYAAEFASEIRRIQSVRHTEGDAPAVNRDADIVQIMTVHKAKGLEFEVVVLPTLLTKPIRSKYDPVFDVKSGMLVDWSRPISTLVTGIGQRLTAAADAEDLRKLYVALTRAKSRLCLPMNPKERANTASKIISATMNYPDLVPPGVVIWPPAEA